MSLIKFKRGTKANLPTLETAEPALTTDTKELFIGTAEGNVQIGNMLKSVYDANNDGVVDNSELLQGQNGAYYLDRTNHSGTVAAATISDFAEAAQDAVGGMIDNTGRAVALTYDDATATLYAEVLFDNVTVKKNGSNQLYAVDGTTLVKGVVQLVDSMTSTSVVTAATPNSVKNVKDALDTHMGAADAHGLDTFLVKSVAAGTNVEVSNVAGVVTVTVPEVGEDNTASNVNTAGVGIFDAKTGVDLGFKGVESSNGSLVVTNVPARKTIDVTHATVTTTSSGSNAGATVVKEVTIANGHVTDFKTGSLGVADVSGAAAASDLTALSEQVDTLQSSGVIEHGTITNNGDGTVTLDGWTAYFAPSRTEVAFDAVDVDCNQTDGPRVIHLRDDGTAVVSTGYSAISDPSNVLLFFTIANGTTLSPIIVMPDMTEVQEIMRAYLEVIDIPVYKMDVRAKASLELSRDAGSILVEGINYTSNGSQNLKAFAADTTIDSLYFDADGEIALPVTYGTVVSPSMYFDGTDIIAVPATKFTVQEIRVTVEGKYFIRYGAQLFDSLIEAKAGMFTAQLAPMNTIYTAISTPVSRLVVKEGTTDLTSATDAYLVKVTISGGTTSGAGGGSGSVVLPISDAENLLYASANPDAQARFIVSGTSAYSHTLQGKSGTLAHISDIAELAQDAFGDAISNVATEAVVLTYNDGAGTISANVKVDAATVVINGTNGNLEVGAITSAKVSDFAEAAQDAVGGAISNAATSSVTLAYDDGAGTFAADAKVDGTTVVKNVTNGNLEVGAIGSGKISDFTEAAQDAVGGALSNTGKAITLSYNDTANTLSAEANIDDSSIKKNGSNQLYVDTIDGGTF
jgi:hypothetical protein